MKRRDFSLALAAGSAAAGGLLTALPAQAQSAFKAGKDYVALSSRAPVDAPADRVEVIEFFSYNCPHCAHFEPELEAWLKKLPKDVSFRRVPVPFLADFEPKQRLYYALEAMGKVDELQMKVFNALHTERLRVIGDEAIIDWVVKQGVDKAKFVEYFKSFSITGKATRAKQIVDAYKLDGVPAMGVAGRYITDGTMAGSMTRALQITDALIAEARKSR
ncbi:thiol:disulfide interchange protein DsbA/DsbL [Curvibacter sp. HBC61]|uniref:Thiol:disulfide interchange protein n=1 Tax=Curvibacter cyanobacteriorum TaxID=3026422 RepID=A0ABT5N690_9BURK|nr:thiol:disulfide interchange protein DsbA/DsbL [Curvibacter sp. HBC61]MDD0840623.1 thiol:disulfide interchange protein DsbA/DsbL [Curvibacter sp. HBC61]